MPDSPSLPLPGDAHPQAQVLPLAEYTNAHAHEHSAAIHAPRCAEAGEPVLGSARARGRLVPLR